MTSPLDRLRLFTGLDTDLNITMSLCYEDDNGDLIPMMGEADMTDNMTEAVLMRLSYLAAKNGGNYSIEFEKGDHPGTLIYVTKEAVN
jgi:hypothetical protein